MADSVAKNLTDAAPLMAEAVLTAQENTSMLVAYVVIIFMASLCVWLGCHYSLRERTKEEKEDVMTASDAAMFPLYASGFLFGLYMIFRYFGKEYINMLLSVYFFLLGVIAVASVLAPYMKPLVAMVLTKDQLSPFHLCFTKGDHEKETTKSDVKVEELFSLKFDYSHVAAYVFSSLLGAWYLYKKHWIANNIFGMCFAINGIELLSLGSYSVGCLLLSGLFFYDVFWVFGTDVMITVAKSFDAPIKLLFPKDCMMLSLFHSKSFAMLGLGDIVIPGVFIALLLRFDSHRQEVKPGSTAPFSKLYFYAGFVAYVLGLVLTVAVMHIWNHPQPALLYLVPACIISSGLLALLRGEMGKLLAYHDNPTVEETKKEN